MKIALISDVFYPYLQGGAEKRYYEIFKRLASNHSVNVFSMQWFNSKEFEIHNNLRIHRTHNISNIYDVEGKRKILPSLMFSGKIISKINKINENQIIEANSFPYFPCFSAKFFSKIKNIPLFITFHEVWENYWFSYLKNPIFASIGKLIEKISTKLPTHIIAVSKNTKFLLVDKLKLNPKKITVIPNGVNIEKFDKYKIEKKSNNILYVGRLTPNKRVDLLIKAISKLKSYNSEITLDIIGTGPLLNPLKHLVKTYDLNDNVKFYGFIKKFSDLINFYKRASIFVLPSIKEGFGIVILEAMAAKTPVIAVGYENSGVLDLIEDKKNGILIKPNSSSDIAKNIQLLLEDKNYQKKIASSGYIKAKEYSWDNISKKTESFYRKFI